MDWNSFLDTVQHAGLIGVLALVVYSGYKRWWVWGYQLVESERAREMWQDLALRNLSTSDTAIAIAAAIHTQSGVADQKGRPR